jgi:hypothetical protein
VIFAINSELRLNDLEVAVWQTLRLMLLSLPMGTYPIQQRRDGASALVTMSFALTVELFTLLQVGGAVAIPRDKRDFSRNLASYEPTIVLLVPRDVDLLHRRSVL